MTIADYLKKHRITQPEFGQRIGVSGGMVSHYINGRHQISAEQAVKIEKATGGEVTRLDLRPDIFGPLGDEAA